MFDTKFGVFIDKPKTTIVLNILGKQAKIKIGQFVFFFGIVLLLSTALLPDNFKLPTGILALVFLFAAKILFGFKPKK